MLKLKRCFHGFQSHGHLHHQFRSLILCSTSSVASNSKDGFANPLMVDFLVKSVGFSQDEAVSIATNTEVSRRFKSSEKSELVVNFFKSSGFGETHIRKVIASVPNVLRSDVEQNLTPKLRVFQELGFSGSDLGLIISQHPHLVNRSLKAHIVPALEMLKSLIGSDEQLVRFLLKTKSQRLLSSNVLKNLPVNLLLLQSYGLSREKIRAFILQRSPVLMRGTLWFEKIVKGVEETLGIPRTSGMFVYGIYALSGKIGDRLESWIEVFGSYGWSEAEIFKLLRRHPLCLTLAKKELRAKLKYYMEDLGLGSDYLAQRPVLLSLSMEKRIVPRTTVMKALKEKQLLKRDLSVYSLTSMAESKFMEKYLLPIKDKLPELYEYYTQTTAGSLTQT